jgi:type I restriction enzyme R subunit
VIEIKEREAARVRIFMDQINQAEKTLVFCATQDRALAVRAPLWSAGSAW